MHADGPLSHRRTLVVLASLLTALFLSALDQTIVSTALPTMVGELGGLDKLSWVVTAYLLTSTTSMPLAGKASDLFGRKPVLLVSVVAFVAASVLCAMAQDMLQLVGARGLQGIGGGAIQACVFAVVADLVPPRQRGRYMGYITGVFALASVTGPFIGGFLVDQIGWRWVFLVNVPLGAVSVAVVSAVLQLPPTRRQARLDLAGATLLTGAVTSLLLVTVWGGRALEWTSPTIVALGVAAVGLTVAFVLVERRAEEPVLPLHVIGHKVVAAGIVLSLLLGAAMFGGTIFLPLFMQTVQGRSATGSGLLMLPMMTGVLISSIVAGRMVTRTGRYKAFPIVGTIGVAAATVLLTRIGVSTTQAYLSAAMLLLGLGVGMSMPVLNLAVQNAVAMRDIGAASSAVSFFRTLGGAAGVAVFGTVFAGRFDRALERQLPDGAPGAVASDPTGEVATSPARILELEPAVREAVVASIADAVGAVFVVSVPLVVAAVVAAVLLKEVPLRDTVGADEPATTEPAVT